MVSLHKFKTLNEIDYEKEQKRTQENKKKLKI